IYVFGQTLGQLESEPAYSVRVYNPKSDTWVFGTNMTSTRYGFSVAVADDVIYVLGGCTVSYPVPYFSFPYGPAIKQWATVTAYYPFNYGHPDPSYDGTPPKVEVLSPQEGISTATNMTLEFTVNESTTSMGYVLDNSKVVEITGNTTLSNLSFGSHSLIVQATDVTGNVGYSETIAFTIAEPTQIGSEFPMVWLFVGVLVVFVAAVCVGVFVYLRKRSRG
ncbi:MAG TPA: kelch repeat-containing protein, partial [Candidatus Acidoferrales bacterium]|nr:kelch repeat-containing protein [Candidatus Acidoferrales bacterium]